MDEQTKQGIVQTFESIIDRNPYYEFIDVRVESVGEGRLHARLPYSEAVEAPALAADGIHGGVITTLVDSVGMGSVIAQKQRPVSLVTEDLSVTFHDAAREDVVAEGYVVSDGSTLVSSRVDVYPESEYGTEDSTLVASGNTTARLFD